MKLHQSLSGCIAYLTAVCSKPGGLPPLRSAAHLDLRRYMGDWRVIACMENSVERGFVDAVESYSLRDDGNLGVTFRWRERHFTAPERRHDFIGWVVDRRTNARWKMRLVPFFSASYVILAVHPNYEWAAVGHPTRKFGWVLARDCTISDATHDEIMGIFQRQGYDTRLFINVPHLSFQPV